MVAQCYDDEGLLLSWNAGCIAGRMILGQDSHSSSGDDTLPVGLGPEYEPLGNGEV